MVVVPATAVLLIPTKWASVEPLAPVVIEVMVFFCTSATPVVEISIPVKVAVPVGLKTIDPVPEAAPMVLPVTVPTLAAPAPETTIPLKLLVVLTQLIPAMVLPCIELAAPAVVARAIPVNAPFCVPPLVKVPA